MRGRGLIGALVVGSLVTLSMPARAQLFSPGKLAQPHADFEGLTNCTKCHEAGDKLSDDLCLDCHTEIEERVKSRRGFHGRLRPVDGGCADCHLDHQGRNFDMVGLDKAHFEHDRTGYRLTGAHVDVKCRDCHDPRLIVDDGVRRLLRKHKGKRTFLGTATRCNGCHFDEHRGQLGVRCDDCHGTKSWGPAPRFDHAKTDFRLRGAHAHVECEECHPRESDDVAHGFPEPVNASSFARYEPVEHAGCISCHDDPHGGALGRRCASCHLESSWTRLKATAMKSRDFHETTRYPLAGAHASVACDACHLPLGRRKSVFKNMKFERCADCHLDAHQGQVGDQCEDCHTLDSFSPTTYGPVEHAQTRYPLEGAHQAVSCLRCHPDERVPRPSPKLLSALKRRRRSWLVSPMVLEPRPHERCTDCHRSPHAGQFRARVKADGCVGCHRITSFSDLDFDHATDTSYPLGGAHIDVTCAGCHPTDAEGVVRYKPLETACASCHADIHGGQFAGRATDGDGCASCHVVTGFSPPTFEHDRVYPLEGKHLEVECAACHPAIAVGEQSVVWYRGVPRECEGCHADFHRGDLPRMGP